MLRLALPVFLLVSIVACSGADTTVPIVHASSITMVGGNGQQANVLHTLAAPLTIMAINTDGSPAVNVGIDWAVTAGGGNLSETSTRTALDGKSSVWWTLGKWGTQSVTASATVVAGQTIQFTATATAPIAIHFDGHAWSISDQDSSGAGMNLASVWVASPSYAVAVGGCTIDPVVRKYNGSSWRRPPGDGCGSYLFPGQYTNVSGNAAGDVFHVLQFLDLDSWAVWIFRETGGPDPDLIYVRNSACCAGLRAVFPRSANDVIAVGDSGEVEHYNGTTWNREPTGITKNLYAVWGTDTEAFAVGEDGTTLHFDGYSWNRQPPVTQQSLYSVWGTSPSNVFAVGEGGAILHFNGSGWFPESSGTKQTLRGVWGSAANAVFAVGDSSTILQYTGSTWSPQSANASIDLHGVWGSSASNVFAVGRSR